jgi:hypothetical protein
VVFLVNLAAGCAHFDPRATKIDLYSMVLFPVAPGGLYLYTYLLQVGIFIFRVSPSVLSSLGLWSHLCCT